MDSRAKLIRFAALKGDKMRAQLIGFATLLILASCSSEPSKTDPAPAVTESPTPPSHNYSEETKGVYYYVAGVSENDKAAGKSAGEVLGFKFLGQNEDGEFIIAAIDDGGKEAGRAFCSKPCRIIRYSTGQKVGYSEDSVIGAVFSDVLSGQLREATR